MEQDRLIKALTELIKKLSANGHRVGSFSSYNSTSKGITLITSQHSFFLSHALVHKLLIDPNLLNAADLAHIIAYNAPIGKNQSLENMAVAMWGAKAKRNR